MDLPIIYDWRGPGDGGLYDRMVTALNTAITELENQGHTVNFRGFIWVQGEWDALNDTSANAYFNNLTTLINDLRINVINDMALPIILGVDEQYLDSTGRHQVLNAHQDIALNDNDIKFTSMYGYPKADATHLTPAGLISHGLGLFDSYQLLISGSYPSDNCSLSSVGNSDSIFRHSWGQSFTTSCSGKLSSVTFGAITPHNDTVTFTLYNGATCNGTVLFTTTLSSIMAGDNVIDLSNEDIYIDKEHSYYFDVVSDSNTEWNIKYSNVDNAFGVLRCAASYTQTCGTSYLNYDMDFSVELESTTLSINDYSQNNIKIYPNPVSDSVIITNISSNINNITIINSLGQIIRNVKPIEQSESVEIDFLNIKQGLYFINIFFENGNTITKKLIK